MNLSGTSVATLAMLFVSLLLAVLVVTAVRPSHVEPPRGEVRAEHRTRPAPTAAPTAEPTPGTSKPKSQTAPPAAPEQPASPTASEPTPLAPPVETPAPEPVAPPVKTGGAPASGETGGAPATETGRPAEPPAEDAPAPRGLAAPTAEAAVTRFYAALDDRRFEAAWDALSPAVRSAFGGFEGWRAGYSGTISSRPSGFRVTAGPGGATAVEHVLTAADRSACGPVEQRFAVTWRLIEVDGAWLAERLTATKRSGPAPASACA